MNYYRFFISNWKILLFAILFTFFSGFGQTFLISLYIQNFLSDFSISQTAYSSIYSSATLLSGLVIIFAGKLIDQIPLKTFAITVVFGIVLANLAAGFSRNIPMLFIGIFMLRFFGQGLLSHTAMTAMGRYFSTARGKALSVAYLGFPVAEAFFPIAIVSTISIFGWRESFLVSAFFILIILLPSTLVLLRNFKKENIKEELIESSKTMSTYKNIGEKTWTQKEIFKNSNFYFFAPTVFFVGFTLTALFFYQAFIADYKGWGLEWMAINITAYAAASFAFSILAGPIIDRLSAKNVFPFILLPMALGIGVLIVFSHPLAATIFWFLVGISAGLNPTVSNALYAEVYGILNLGSVRSLYTFVMVASTAFGPVIYSLLMDVGLNFNQIHLFLIGAFLINSIFLLFRHLRN